MDFILDLTTDFHFSAKNPIAIVKIDVPVSHLMSLVVKLSSRIDLVTVLSDQSDKIH